MIPRRAGVIPKTAWSEETRMSQAIAISRPPPKAKPYSMAITGDGNDSRARIMSSNGFEESSTWASPEPPAGIWVMSYPAQNASVPSPRSITHRVSSAATAARAARSSLRIFRFSAFFFAGLETVRVATVPSRSTITLPPMKGSFPVARIRGAIIMKISTPNRKEAAEPAAKRKGDSHAPSGIPQGDQAEGRRQDRAEAVRAEGQGRALHVLPAAPGVGPALPEGQRRGPGHRRTVGRRAELRPHLPPARVGGDRHRGGRHAPQEPRRLDEARRDDPHRGGPGLPPEGAGQRPRQRAVPPRPEGRTGEDRGRGHGLAARREAGLREAGVQAGGHLPRPRAGPDRGAPRPAGAVEGPRGVLGEHPDPRVLLLPHEGNGRLTRLQG